MSALSEKSEKTSFFDNVKYEHLVAGFSAGITSTIVLHPLDVVKIRFAVHDGKSDTTPKYNGILNAFSTIYKNERLKGLYRGVTPNIWGAGSCWGLYFLFYNSMKSFYQNGNINTTLSAGSHMLAASEAGLLSLLLTNPIWVAKTRMCLQYATETQNVKMYNGMVDCLVKIYAREGFRGYYKGLVPGIFGVSHGAVQFMVYEELKKWYYQYYALSVSTKLGTKESLAFSASSKLIAVLVTYPYQVVRARLQNQHHQYEGAVHCIKETWNFEGWRGFYKGMGANLLRVTPATMITFWTYENISHFLLKYNSRGKSISNV